MDTNSGNPGGEATRVSASADTGPLAPQQQSDPAKTTYIPPELRPAGVDTSYSDYAGSGQGSAPPQPAAYAPAQPAPQDRKDYRHNRPPILFPLLLIGAGIIFLLNNVGVLPWNVWGQLWKLWPLILIAIGLEILIGRRNPLLSFIIVLVALVIGAGILYWGGGFTWSGNTEQMSLSVPLGAAKSANVSIDMGAGNLDVTGDADSEMLAMGTLEYYENGSQPQQSANTSGSKTELTISQKGDNAGFIPFMGGWNDNDRIDWNVQLNDQVPITNLTVDSGAGNGTLDLEQLKIEKMDVNYGAGNINVTLPDTNDASGSIKNGAGNIEIVVPEGVAAHINAHSGLGNVNAEGDYTSAGKNIYESEGYSTSDDNKVDIEVNTGVGNITINFK